MTAAPTVPIRLLIADDQALVRGALGALLDLEPDLEVQGLAADGAEALRLAEELQPDVCLMDIQMPGVDGVEATKRIRAASPQTRVLVVTTFARPGYLRAALDAGASGFVVKDTPAEELAAAVRRVHAGLRVLDPKLAEESLFEGANPLSDRRVPRHRPRLRAAAGRRRTIRGGHRGGGLPVGGHGAQPPLRRDRQDRRREPGAGGADRVRQGLALTPLARVGGRAYCEGRRVTEPDRRSA